MHGLICTRPRLIIFKSSDVDGLRSQFSEPCEKERWLDPYGTTSFPGTFQDFKEMIIQFGYVTLFAASFPLAALCAMVNNVTEIRSPEATEVGLAESSGVSEQTRG